MNRFFLRCLLQNNINCENLFSELSENCKEFKGKKQIRDFMLVSYSKFGKLDTTLYLNLLRFFRDHKIMIISNNGLESKSIHVFDILDEIYIPIVYENKNTISVHHISIKKLSCTTCLNDRPEWSDNNLNLCSNMFDYKMLRFTDFVKKFPVNSSYLFCKQFNTFNRLLEFMRNNMTCWLVEGIKMTNPSDKKQIIEWDYQRLEQTDQTFQHIMQIIKNIPLLTDLSNIVLKYTEYADYSKYFNIKLKSMIANLSIESI